MFWSPALSHCSLCFFFLFLSSDLKMERLLGDLKMRLRDESWWGLKVKVAQGSVH